MTAESGLRPMLFFDVTSVNDIKGSRTFVTLVNRLL